MSEEKFHCWRCSAELGDLIFPLSRRDECPACRAELHVCRACTLYDPRVADACREERAEAVTDKTTANFCDYFSLRSGVAAATSETGDARSAAEALFGGATADNSPAASKSAARPEHLDKAEKARRQLKDLFGED